MAHKKGAGSTDNGRDSISKRLGVKVFGGQIAISGNIIVRQRGTRFHPGKGVGMGKDHTIYAVTDGTVVFTKKKNDRTYISVIPVGADMEELLPINRAQVEVISPEVTEKEISIAKEDDDEAVASISANPEEETAKEEKPAPKAKKVKGDDLKKIEGIGPKIAGLLADAGLDTFRAVADSDAEKIKEILAEAGSRYASHDPTTWPEQAALAADEKWDELKKWQDELDGGRA